MKIKIRTLCEISMFTALMAVCSWIAVPFAIPFTLQTFALFLCLLLLGGKKSFVCMAVYLFIGIIGLPVFSSFGSGFGVLFGASGGFLWGFLLASAVFWILTSLFKTRDRIKLLGCFVSMAVYYLFGTLWYFLLYTGEGMTVSSAFLSCVAPFIIPDVVKLLLAYLIYLRLKKVICIKDI